MSIASVSICMCAAPLLSSFLIFGSPLFLFDRDGKKMLRIISEPRPSKESIREFWELLEKCTYLTEREAAELGPEVVRVYARWAPCIKEEEKILHLMMKSGVTVRVREAADFETAQSGGSNSRPASPETVRVLNKNPRVRNAEKLFFYPRMIVEMTYNWVDHFCHGQIGIILEVPSSEALSSWAPIEVLLAPVGTKNAPDATETRESLIRQGWTPVLVRQQKNDKCVTVRSNLLGFRCQYPFK